MTVFTISVPKVPTVDRSPSIESNNRLSSSKSKDVLDKTKSGSISVNQQVTRPNSSLESISENSGSTKGPSRDSKDMSETSSVRTAESKKPWISKLMKRAVTKIKDGNDSLSPTTLRGRSASTPPKPNVVSTTTLSESNGGGKSFFSRRTSADASKLSVSDRGSSTNISRSRSPALVKETIEEVPAQEISPAPTIVRTSSNLMAPVPNSAIRRPSVSVIQEQPALERKEAEQAAPAQAAMPPSVASPPPQTIPVPNPSLSEKSPDVSQRSISAPADSSRQSESYQSLPKDPLAVSQPSPTPASKEADIAETPKSPSLTRSPSNSGQAVSQLRSAISKERERREELTSPHGTMPLLTRTPGLASQESTFRRSYYNTDPEKALETVSSYASTPPLMTRTPPTFADSSNRRSYYAASEMDSSRLDSVSSRTSIETSPPGPVNRSLESIRLPLKHSPSTSETESASTISPSITTPTTAVEKSSPIEKVDRHQSLLGVSTSHPPLERQNTADKPPSTPTGPAPMAGGAILNPSSTWQEFVDPEKLKALLPKEKHRQTAIWELISTEKDYVRDLRLLVNVSTFCLLYPAEQQYRTFNLQLSNGRFSNKKSPKNSFWTSRPSSMSIRYEIYLWRVADSQEFLTALEARFQAEGIIQCVGDIVVKYVSLSHICIT